MAEDVEVALDTYRDRMMYIQKLTYNAEMKCPNFVVEAVLRYLTGNFYINFSLIWEPTTKVIITYAEEDSAVITVFWNLWVEILKEAVELCGRVFFFIFYTIKYKYVKSNFIMELLA